MLLRPTRSLFAACFFFSLYVWNQWQTSTISYKVSGHWQKYWRDRSLNGTAHSTDLDLSTPSPYAYVFYATQEHYACSVLVNIERLQNALHTKHRIFVLATDELDQRYITAFEERNVTVSIQEVPPLAEGGSFYYRDCLLKLMAFKMHHIDPTLKRVLMLDSDQLIMQNMDDLFEDLPETDLAAPRAYWIDRRTLSSTFMMITLTDRLWNVVSDAVHNITTDKYDMDLVNDLLGDTVLMLPGHYITLNSHWEDWNLPSWYHEPETRDGMTLYPAHQVPQLPPPRNDTKTELRSESGVEDVTPEEEVKAENHDDFPFEKRDQMSPSDKGSGNPKALNSAPASEKGDGVPVIFADDDGLATIKALNQRLKENPAAAAAINAELGIVSNPNSPDAHPPIRIGKASDKDATDAAYKELEHPTIFNPDSPTSERPAEPIHHDQDAAKIAEIVDHPLVTTTDIAHALGLPTNATSTKPIPSYRPHYAVDPPTVSCSPAAKSILHDDTPLSDCELENLRPIEPPHHAPPPPTAPFVPEEKPLYKELFNLYPEASVIHFFALGKPWTFTVEDVRRLRPYAHPVFETQWRTWRETAVAVCPSNVLGTV